GAVDDGPKTNVASWRSKSCCPLGSSDSAVKFTVAVPLPTKLPLKIWLAPVTNASRSVGKPARAAVKSNGSVRGVETRSIEPGKLEGLTCIARVGNGCG